MFVAAGSTDMTPVDTTLERTEMDKVKIAVVMTKEQIFNSDWFTYLWVLGVSLWGGMVSFFEKDTEPFSWRRLAVRLLSASFAGMMTAYVCQAGGITGPLMGAFAGVAAHMGTPALMRLKMVRQFFEKE